MRARRIEVKRHRRTTAVVVDGVEIPANAIRIKSVTVPVNPTEPPSVSLELIAAEVSVVNNLESVDDVEGVEVRGD